MGSLVPGWDSGFEKPRGIEDFDETCAEPDTPGVAYQRRLLRKYSSRGAHSVPIDIVVGAARSPTDRELGKSPVYERSASLRIPQRRHSLDRTLERSHSLGADVAHSPLRLPSMTMRGAPGGGRSPLASPHAGDGAAAADELGHSFRRMSLERRSIDRPPNLERLSAPPGGSGGSGTPRSPFASPHAMDAGEFGGEEREHKTSWWGRLDSSALNRPVEEEEEEPAPHSEATFTPQFGVAGQGMHYTCATSKVEHHAAQ